MGQRRGPAVLLLALGHLAGLLASGTACDNVYRGFSDCVLKLGENMATYEETDGIELQGLHRVCGYMTAKKKKEVMPILVLPVLGGSLVLAVLVSGQMELAPPCSALHLWDGAQGNCVKPTFFRAIALPHQRYWDEFHTCALEALWKCHKEAAAIWERLRRESRQVKFQGSLFDLCSPSTAQSFAWTHMPKVSVLCVPLIVTWLNL